MNIFEQAKKIAESDYEQYLKYRRYVEPYNQNYNINHFYKWYEKRINDNISIIDEYNYEFGKFKKTGNKILSQPYLPNSSDTYYDQFNDAVNVIPKYFYIRFPNEINCISYINLSDK
jgi:hypothetical protein